MSRTAGAKNGLFQNPDVDATVTWRSVPSHRSEHGIRRSPRWTTVSPTSKLSISTAPSPASAVWPKWNDSLPVHWLRSEDWWATSSRTESAMKSAPERSISRRPSATRLVRGSKRSSSAAVVGRMSGSSNHRRGLSRPERPLSDHSPRRPAIRSRSQYSESIEQFSELHLTCWTRLPRRRFAPTCEVLLDHGGSPRDEPDPEMVCDVDVWPFSSSSPRLEECRSSQILPVRVKATIHPSGV